MGHKRVPFWRVVAEMEALPNGTLARRAGVAWRREPATGEADLPRRLARLADASPGAVVAFASVHGPLARRTSVLHQAPEPHARAGLHQLASGLADQVGEALGELRSGAPLSSASARMLEFGEIMAVLPADVWRAAQQVLAGDDGSVASPEQEDQPIDVGAALTLLGETMYAHAREQGEQAFDPAAAVQSLEVVERWLRVMAGLDDAPPALLSVGGMVPALREVMSSYPDLFARPELAPEGSRAGAELMQDIATETIDEWRAAAVEVGVLVAAVQLLRRAERGGLGTGDKNRLLEAVRAAEALDGSPRISAAEFADRARPVLRARLEGRLLEGGVWPVRTGSTVGTYWRAIAALWQSLTGELPPRQCVQPGCPSLIPPHGNRRYCDAHRTARRREAMRHRRAGIDSTVLSDKSIWKGRTTRGRRSSGA
jgi:hypothetical protein